MMKSRILLHLKGLNILYPFKSLIPKKSNRLPSGFLKTIFERVTEDKGGNIWYGLRLAVLQEYPEKLRQKNFYEMISQVNATFDEIDIYWAALLCRAVMGMIENSQVYPFLDTETTRTQSIQKLIEGGVFK